MQRILLKTITIVGTVIAVVTGIYTIYHEAIEDRSPILNISIENSEQATRLSKINGLKATYIFKKREIKNFWTLDIRIENTSNTTIIGKGNKKNIIGDSLSLFLAHPYKLLDGSFTENNFNDVSFRSDIDTIINLRFIQWRPKERIRLRLYIEGDTSATRGPSFWMNDRQIIDGKITYEEQLKKDYKGFLPSKVKSKYALFGLGLIAIFVFAEAFVFALIYFIDHTISLFVYRIWKDKYYSDYKLKVQFLNENNVILKKYDPYNLPGEFWLQLDNIPKPKKTVNENQIYTELTLACLIAAGTVIGILWIIPLGGI
ncbi:hypothetical protein [Hymenobacter crusticola]|nr:hypothetical protein [Hymenobacter crusticola]